MATVKLVKSIYTGSDVTSLGELASTDSVDLNTPNITNGLTLTGSAGTAGQALLSNGSGSAPTWGAAGVSTGKSIAMAMIFGF